MGRWMVDQIYLLVEKDFLLAHPEHLVLSNISMIYTSVSTAGYPPSFFIWHYHLHYHLHPLLPTYRGHEAHYIYLSLSLKNQWHQQWIEANYLFKVEVLDAKAWLSCTSSFHVTSDFMVCILPELPYPILLVWNSFYYNFLRHRVRISSILTAIDLEAFVSFLSA